MGESKHTPGPWVVDYGRDYNRRDRPVAIYAPNDAGVPGAVGHIVRKNGIGLPSSDRAKANARLIAAAPDLLEMCQRLFEIVRLQNGNLHDDINAIQAEALAVIAKAKGGE